MEDYKKYFVGHEARLNELEKLHKRKDLLKKKLEKEKLENFSIELSGLPRTGKTNTVNRIYDYFKMGDIDISKLEEPAGIIKEKYTCDEISNFTRVDFNDKTLEISRELLEKEKNKGKNSIIIMDRGVIDNYFWYEMMYEDNILTKDEFYKKISNLEEDISKINQLYVLFSEPNTIVYRDYLNEIYLEDRKKTTLEGVSKLRDSYYNLLPLIKNNNIDLEVLDTTGLKEMDTSIKITNHILDGIDKKLVLKK